MGKIYYTDSLVIHVQRRKRTNYTAITYQSSYSNVSKLKLKKKEKKIASILYKNTFLSV